LGDTPSAKEVIVAVSRMFSNLWILNVLGHLEKCLLKQTILFKRWLYIESTLLRAKSPSRSRKRCLRELQVPTTIWLRVVILAMWIGKEVTLE
jgi:hypothetical protein